MLFNSDSVKEWDAILNKYSIALDHHVASKKDDTLAELDEWYQNTLPTILATRKPQSIDSSELCKLMSWKLKVRKCPKRSRLLNLYSTLLNLHSTQRWLM